MSAVYVDPNRPHVVYRAFDAEGRLLYIGMTCNLFGRKDGRLAVHRRRGVWFQDAAVWILEGYPTRPAAWAAEQHAIRTEGAVHNVTYREIGRRGWKSRRVAPVSRRRVVAPEEASA